MAVRLHGDVRRDPVRWGRVPSVGPASPTPSFPTKTKERNGEVGERTARLPSLPRRGHACSSELHHADKRLSQFLAHRTHRQSHPGTGCSSRPNQGHTQGPRLPDPWLDPTGPRDADPVTQTRTATCAQEGWNMHTKHPLFPLPSSFSLPFW